MKVQATGPLAVSIALTEGKKSLILKKNVAPNYATPRLMPTLLPLLSISAYEACGSCDTDVKLSSKRHSDHSGMGPCLEKEGAWNMIQQAKCSYSEGAATRCCQPTQM